MEVRTECCHGNGNEWEHAHLSSCWSVRCHWLRKRVAASATTPMSKKLMMRPAVVWAAALHRSSSQKHTVPVTPPEFISATYSLLYVWQPLFVVLMQEREIPSSLLGDSATNKEAKTIAFVPRYIAYVQRKINKPVESHTGPRETFSRGPFREKILIFLNGAFWCTLFLSDGWPADPGVITSLIPPFDGPEN